MVQTLRSRHHVSGYNVLLRRPGASAGSASSRCPARCWSVDPRVGRRAIRGGAERTGSAVAPPRSSARSAIAH